MLCSPIQEVLILIAIVSVQKLRCCCERPFLMTEISQHKRRMFEIMKLLGMVNSTVLF